MIEKMNNFAGVESREARMEQKAEPKANLDELDYALLQLLCDNPELTYRELAVQLKKSPATVLNRLRQLRKSGVIKGQQLVLDYEKLGYDIFVITELQIGKGKLRELEQKVARHPNVVAVYDCTGSFDATIFARFKNTRSMDAFLKKIQTYDFVERTNTRLVLNTIKERSLLP